MGDNRDDHELPTAGDRYRIDGPLGEGGMAVVYRAFDRQLQRPVALKFLRSRETGTVEHVLREARAQAAIIHEHVCRVFEVGEHCGRGFLAMQLIEGESLQAVAPDLDLEDKLMLLEQVARAVAAAHRGGVFHRDLSPRNVMVEHRPDGGLHAFVTDFGIARSDAGDRIDTEPASFESPAFRAPEVLRGDAEVSERAVDVYGLGATAYAALAEQAPYFGSSREETERRVLDGRPMRLGLVVPGMPAAVETVVETAMARHPNRRYRSADAVAEDLRRWRAGRSVLAGPVGPVSRLGAWWRNRRAGFLAIAATVLVVASATAVLLWDRQRSAQRRTLVDRHRAEVEQIDRVLRRARMMPLHDTTAAVREVRRRMARVEAGLLEHGPIARGPASFALGFGHLMLREFDQAELWLRSAIEGGSDDAPTRTALGIALAMQRLEPIRAGRREGVPGGREEIDEAMLLLSARGPRTIDRDGLHRALALFVDDRLGEAVEAARLAARRSPWLYEATQLEGDLLVIIAARRARDGDLEAARAGLLEAGLAYASALEIARSDAWLYEAEADRALRLAELQPDGDVGVAALVDRAITAAAAARRARPDRFEAALLLDRAEAVASRIAAPPAESRGAGAR